MRLPRRKWEVQVLTVDRDGIVLQRERTWKYWLHSSAIREMNRANKEFRWGYVGYRPLIMVARIK